MKVQCIHRSMYVAYRYSSFFALQPVSRKTNRVNANFCLQKILENDPKNVEHFLREPSTNCHQTSLTFFLCSCYLNMESPTCCSGPGK